MSLLNISTQNTATAFYVNDNTPFINPQYGHLTVSLIAIGDLASTWHIISGGREIARSGLETNLFSKE